jgi:hypothetical protein
VSPQSELAEFCGRRRPVLDRVTYFEAFAATAGAQLPASLARTECHGEQSRRGHGPLSPMSWHASIVQLIVDWLAGLCAADHIYERYDCGREKCRRWLIAWQGH